MVQGMYFGKVLVIMGYFVHFFAFDEKPNIDKLQDYSSLSNWDLYQRIDTEHYFLVGQGEQDEITFDNLTFGDVKRYEREFFVTLNDSYIQAKGQTKMGLQIGSNLSEELEQTVFWAYGDDDTHDAGFVFQEGKLLRAKFQIDWNKIAEFHENEGSKINLIYLEDADPDFVEPRYLNQLVLEEMNSYFNSETSYKSFDPLDLPNSEFTKIASSVKKTKKKTKWWQRFTK